MIYLVLSDVINPIMIRESSYFTLEKILFFFLVHELVVFKNRHNVYI